MKVKFIKDCYEWKAGVVYPAEPFFFNNKQLVKVYLPGYAISIAVPWEYLEIVG